MLKLRIDKIDRYGYNGRDHHPSVSDQGLVVRVVSCMIDDETDTVMWTVITNDDRILELVEHEVTILQPGV